ncbi:MAG: YggT family protein [Anaerolineales bacterium]
MFIIVQVINTFAEILILLVILSAILSYFMDPYHPVRRGINSVVEPLLAPIRQVIPPVGMIDFSPLILIVLIQLAKQIIISLLL